MKRKEGKNMSIAKKTVSVVASAALAASMCVVAPASAAAAEASASASSSEQCSISSAMLETNTFELSEEPLKPVFRLGDGTLMTEGVDYELFYFTKNNTWVRGVPCERGSHTIKIMAIPGGCSATLGQKTFRISVVDEYSLNNAKIAYTTKAGETVLAKDGIAAALYTGGEVKPAIRIYDAKQQLWLVEGRDYQLEYLNPYGRSGRSVMAHIVVSGLGSYSHSEIGCAYWISDGYTLEQISNHIAVSFGAESHPASGERLQFLQKNCSGLPAVTFDSSFSFKEGPDYTVACTKDGQPVSSCSGLGTYQLTITPRNANMLDLNAGPLTVFFDVVEKEDISGYGVFFNGPVEGDGIPRVNYGTSYGIGDALTTLVEGVNYTARSVFAGMYRQVWEMLSGVVFEYGYIERGSGTPIYGINHGDWVMSPVYGAVYGPVKKIKKEEMTDEIYDAIFGPVMNDPEKVDAWYLWPTYKLQVTGMGSYTGSLSGYYSRKDVVVAPEETMDMTVTETEAFPGEEIVVTVELSNNPGVAGMNVAVDYDVSSLALVSVEKGEIIKNAETFTPITAFGSTMVLWASNKVVNANGELLRMTFKVADGATLGKKNVTVVCNGGIASGINGERYAVRTNSSGVKVMSAMPGDVYNDGVIDIRDAVAMQRCMAGLTQASKHVQQVMDVDGDGVKGSARDLLSLAKQIIE